MIGSRASEELGRHPGITPDEAQMLRKRHQWREKVLALCLEHLREEPETAAVETAGLARSDGVWERFRTLAADIDRDVPRLLQTELGVPVLEAHRHGANYFLDHLILFVRQRSEQRSRSSGDPPSAPLEGLSPELLRHEVRLALELSSESLGVFLNDLVALEEFELEVRHQRRRLQCLLGCDRSLRDLAETNAEIIEAPPEELAEIVGEFFRICGLLQHELPPLLAVGSPFPRLAAELEAAREQLDRVVADSIEPLNEIRARVDGFDNVIQPLVTGLRKLESQLEGILHGRPSGTGSRASGELARARRMQLQREVASLEKGLRKLADGVVPAGLEALAGAGRKDLERPLAAARGELAVLPGELRGLLAHEGAAVARALGAGMAWSAGDDKDDQAAGLLDSLVLGLRRLHEGPLREALQAMEKLSEANALLLKKRICQELGSIRATFLQPRFAYIAAHDPRSTHTPQYFYIKEFADEATRSQELLHFVHELWSFVEEIQEAHIEGLRLTPKNLNRIASRVLLEKRSVPAGPGWRELAGFLTALKDRLVPRLQQVCALPGIRFDDRNQLTAFAEELARSCSELLAQRESARRLVDALEALAESEAVEPRAHQRYQEAVLRVTCEEMAQKLRRVSRVLMELVPYVGAMIGGIRMRTSLAFATDPRLPS